MKHQVKSGQTDYTVLVFIPDPASTDGSGKTGLVAADLTVSGVRVETDNDVTVIDYTSTLNNLSALTDAHADWGLKEVSSSLAPGLYRLDIADALFATGIWSCVVYVQITSSAAAASPMEFVMVPVAPVDGMNVETIKGGAVVNGGTITFPTNSTLASTTNITAGTITTASTVSALANGAITANSIAVDAITASKIQDGAIDAATFAANAITATVIADGAITAAKIADGAIDAATFASGALDAVWSVAARTLTAGTNIQLPSDGLDNVTAWTVNITGNVDGSVGSVAGDINGNIVGSVQGNVDGNVASVTGSVGSVASGGIAAASFAAGAIDATAIAANAIGASELASDAVLEIADALLNRDMSAVSDTNSRSPLNALRFLRNKWSVAAGTLTVTKENDTTAAWTSAMTTDAAAEPIIGSNPA